MVNEPMPWQLTVGQLRQALREVPDEGVVCLVVRPPGIGDKEFTVFYNLRVEYAGGGIVKFVPLSTPQEA